jgi:fatty acid desaturase
MVGARTVLNPSPIGRLADYINFGITKHGLHHQYPQVPHDNLEKAYDLRVSSDGEFDGAPVFPTYLRAMMDMAPHLLRPSTGVNLGPLVSASPRKPDPSEPSVN